MGKFGWFGIKKQEVDHNGLNWAGLVLVVLAMGVFFFIKPTIENKEDQKNERKPLNESLVTVKFKK